jgi:hypothetical protein
MKKLEKALDQYIRDKHTQEECSAYIDGWEDGIDSMDSRIYWVLALGMVLGSIITVAISLI